MAGWFGGKSARGIRTRSRHTSVRNVRLGGWRQRLAHLRRDARPLTNMRHHASHPSPVRGSGDLGERPTQQPTTAQAGGGDDDHAGARRHAGGTRLWMYVPMLLNIVEMSWPRIVAPSATTRAIKPTSRAYSAIVAPFVSRASRRMISI